jgi:hypothetical protein
VAVELSPNSTSDGSHSEIGLQVGSRSGIGLWVGSRSGMGLLIGSRIGLLVGSGIGVSVGSRIGLLVGSCSRIGLPVRSMDRPLKRVANWAISASSWSSC